MIEFPSNAMKSQEPAVLASIPSQLEGVQSGGSDSDNIASLASQILHERALVLAHPPREENADVESLEVVEFTLSKESYAFETAFLKEVHQVGEIAFLPGAPSFVSGLVNIRGQIVLVINLKVFFDLQDNKSDERKQVLVVESVGRQIGILVDAVRQIKRIPHNDLQGPLPTLSGVKSEFVRGITKDRTIILDANRLMLSENILINDNEGCLDS
jgi:purine-binding chemotaxis protein CheW